MKEGDQKTDSVNIPPVHVIVLNEILSGKACFNEWKPEAIDLLRDQLTASLATLQEMYKSKWSKINVNLLRDEIRALSNTNPLAKDPYSNLRERLSQATGLNPAIVQVNIANCLVDSVMMLAGGYTSYETFTMRKHPRSKLLWGDARGVQKTYSKPGIGDFRH